MKCLVSEIFVSIDGEAYHAGRPTVFFRTLGCNLRCAWCDSEYTFYPEDGSVEMTLEEALSKVMSFGIKHVTITGGEPLIPKNKDFMLAFIDALLVKGYAVDIETNGSIDLAPYREHFYPEDDVVFIMDWKCPGSGMASHMKESNLKLLSHNDVLKCVVTDNDFETVEALLGKTDATIYISPVFGQVTMHKIPEFVLEHKNCENLVCQLQLHKYFWDPKRRGV